MAKKPARSPSPPAIEHSREKRGPVVGGRRPRCALWMPPNQTRESNIPPLMLPRAIYRYPEEQMARYTQESFGQENDTLEAEGHF